VIFDRDVRSCAYSPPSAGPPRPRRLTTGRSPSAGWARM
jgi:hypothetical protein